MKRQILTFAMVIPVIGLFSQTIKYSDLNAAKPKQQYQTYVSKTGEIYSVGDKVVIGIPSRKNNTFVYVKKVDAMGTVSAVGSEVAGMDAIIKRIRVAGTPHSGDIVSFQAQGAPATYNYVIYVENAIASREIKLKGAK